MVFTDEVEINAASQPVYPIRLERLAGEKEVGAAAAEFVRRQLEEKPASVLLLPTGRTPLLMYAGLVEWAQQAQPEAQANLSQVQTFNLDEFYGLAAEHPGSYHSYMQRALFDHVAIRPEHIHLLDGSAADTQQECARYEAQIAAAGGIDLAVLGIGANGHIGFNEPGTTLDSRTHLVSLQPSSRAANAVFFDNRVEDVPQAALTAGIATILQARRILILATGQGKAQAVSQMLSGPITADLPASFLRLHPAVTLLADQEAANRS